MIASQIEGLRGAERDARATATMLEARGFEVDLRTGDLATRAGILAGYDALIEQSGPETAAVVYYAGHGFYGRIPGEDVIWQCLAPTDLRAGTVDDFRGITAWELSIKQTQLTSRTRNVIVILDCCHSARMSRDAAVLDAIPRALPHPVELGFAAHLAALRARYGAAVDAVDPLGNPEAVRLIACGQTESAYEYRGAAGAYRGAFTEALLEVLDGLRDAIVSWAAIADAIRARVLRRIPAQRPDVEGPARRRLFSLTEDNDRGIVTIREVGGRLELPVGRLIGVEIGDVYGVMPVGSTSYDRARAIAEVAVAEVLPLASRTAAPAWKNGHQVLPVDSVAIPIVKQATRRPVALDVTGAARSAIEQAIAETRTLRVAAPGEPALATLRLAGDRLTVEDQRGPLFPPAPFPAELETSLHRVASLGLAEALRWLQGEHGVFRNELEIELGTVEAGARWRLPDHGAALGLRDRFYIQVRNVGRRQLFVHVFNVGLQGKVALLTGNIAPSGVALQGGGDTFVLGERPNGTLAGIGIVWPEGLPRAGFPRIDEYFVIVTSVPVSLAALETPTRARAAHRGAETKLQALLAQLQDGQVRDEREFEQIEGFYMSGLSYMLHPRDAAMGGLAFEIDENPTGHTAARETAAWLVLGIDATAPAPALALAAADAPHAIAIRLADLVVHKHRAVLSGDIRIDALICTRAPEGRSGYATWTQEFVGIGDGERLPLDHGLLYLGPVCDFVDVVLFVSRHIRGGLDLARLLAEQASSPELRDAAAALQITAGPAAAPWVNAVGASAALARTAYDLLRDATGQSIGLYRTSFLRRERFGVGRHPTESVYRARDFSFSLLIEPAET